ncbi:MAG: bifunctional diguanylate cyclase/phosphodiesterase, partial [Gammaproteobacteria bacterium]|nr:bifunctional diguanylate cyclase/phosphodiesterase [Gammaproteobacteria bacterium]
DRLETAIIRSQRFSKMFALLFIDLDRFKQVNDSLGHLIGDEILRMVGQRLGNNVRQVDTVARLGGDEFIIILDNIEKIRDVSIIAEDIIKDVSTVYLVDNKEVSIGASIGISIYPTNGKDAETLLSQSDIAMYQAKQTGRNRHHFFTEEVDAASKGRMQFEQDLRLALDKEQFELYYQPVVDDKHQKLVSAEALIRWLHPTDGLILPDDFIPLAEETGVIFELSRWVLDAVCKQLAIWEQSNQPLCTIAINLPSAEHLCGFTKHYVKKITDQYQVSPSRLIFEITEGLMMENTEKSILWLNSLRDLGVHISIDDFGIGYSSLSYLKRYPVDSLKIDRSFIKNIVSDNHNQLLVDTFVSIANSMQLELVAEGVETLEQMKYLQEHQSNCHLIQGDFYSKPLAIADFEHFRDTFNT